MHPPLIGGLYSGLPKGREGGGAINQRWGEGKGEKVNNTENVPQQMDYERNVRIEYGEYENWI